jgi:hypothetical protein
MIINNIINLNNILVETIKNNKAYSQFLNSMDWNYYGTFSTPYKLTQKAARRAIERFCEFMKQYCDKTLIFFASEPFDVKDGMHIHCLIKLTNLRISENFMKKEIEKLWIRSTGSSTIKGKSSRIYLEEYIKDLGAHEYLTKYINRKNADYDFIGI